MGATGLQEQLRERAGGEAALVVQLVSLRAPLLLSGGIVDTDWLADDERLRWDQQRPSGPEQAPVAQDADQVAGIQGIGERQVGKQLALLLLFIL